MFRFVGLFLFCFLQQLQAQVTFIISDLPASTSKPIRLFAAGTFNQWNPADSLYAFHLNARSEYELVCSDTGMIELKITQGNWESAEGTQDGKVIPNRKYRVKNKDVINLKIAGWERSSTNKSTALSNVQELKSFQNYPNGLPKRKIWVCLPESYSQSETLRYPVIYMQDGQNLFDDSTSYSGEWGLDEYLKSLGQNTFNEAIIIGIEHSSNRTLEYTPWQPDSMKGGEGFRYVDFITHQVKPYVDSVFRTLPEAKYTCIGGSSLGGLISLTAALQSPHVFGRAMVFSPAIWINHDSLITWVKTLNLENGPALYFCAGDSESRTMLLYVEELIPILQKRGLKAERIFYRKVEGGRHSESTWKDEFSKAWNWISNQYD